MCNRLVKKKKKKIAFLLKFKFEQCCRHTALKRQLRLGSILPVYISYLWFNSVSQCLCSKCFHKPYKYLWPLKTLIKCQELFLSWYNIFLSSSSVIYYPILTESLIAWKRISEVRDEIKHSQMASRTWYRIFLVVWILLPFLQTLAARFFPENLNFSHWINCQIFTKTAFYF